MIVYTIKALRAAAENCLREMRAVTEATPAEDDVLKELTGLAGELMVDRSFSTAERREIAGRIQAQLNRLQES